MDSAGLAQAVTNYWSATYLDQHQNESGGNPLPIISIAGVYRRIKRPIKSLSKRLAFEVRMKLEGGTKRHIQRWSRSWRCEGIL